MTNSLSEQNSDQDQRPSDDFSTKVKDKFIAFVDILGFKNMVDAAEQTGGDMRHLIELTRMLGSNSDSQKFTRYGPTICPHSTYISRDLDFKVTQISDCVVVSAESSPAGLINLIHHCFGIAINLLAKGHLCRGVITRGNILHSDSQFMGTGYADAYKNEQHVSVFRVDEKERGTPFIQVASPVVVYVSTLKDDCVRKMFARMTDSDGTYTAISPFRALGNAPSAIVGPDFDPHAMKASCQRSRKLRLDNLGMFEKSEADADDQTKAKIAHYKKGLLHVIARLDEKERKLDRMIETGQIPYGSTFL